MTAISPAAAQPAPSVTLPEPQMEGALAFSAQPPVIDTGALGDWYVDGVLSGLGLVQSDPVGGDRTALADISNGQVFIQKIKGVVQFYAQVGAYALPSLGTAYGHLDEASDALHNFFSVVPQAFIKITPLDGISIEAGKLPTLIGPEDAFDFEDYNIERGLLWAQTQSVSRGVQADATIGPVVLSLSWNDGYYSDRYTWLSGSATWTIDPASTLVIDAAGNLGGTRLSTIASPLALNNSSIYNLIYTYKKAALTVTPYLQYNHVEADPSVGLYSSASTYGGAVIADYIVTPMVQLAGRAEYIKSAGGASRIAPTNLLYGAKSGAYSFTITPTFTHDRFFLRADASVVHVTGLVPGNAFGRDGRAGTQLRGVIEGGIIF